eukprot:CAMPEP_0174371454 /NCGR_PEP_ID=MMETSP0811_2-20130205/99835_1 /TAXON_ID=73025 ORGANISM="Eutreptiella gymnastica-like, Strain CCMP1594" /NCGR_SAMPLE_ID=MMETSP0811_2 /ASSEMBLY_ACC=CAM_ASM_000667 /LENGTH=82 /DNA_ID=CAMNT_0015517845 /DNA_START=278 /DNA_END=523 /DNA_ORIENTATION=+
MAYHCGHGSTEDTVPWTASMRKMVTCSIVNLVGWRHQSYGTAIWHAMTSCFHMARHPTKTCILHAIISHHSGRPRKITLPFD